MTRGKRSLREVVTGMFGSLLPKLIQARGACVADRSLGRVAKAVYNLFAQTGFDMQALEATGEKVGLTRYETSRAAVWPRTFASGTVGRLCGKLVFIAVLLVIMVMTVTTQAIYVEPLPTYIPGTLYASIGPKDFGG